MNNFSARFRYAIVGILVLLSSTAAAAPQNDIMLVLDNSGSMRKNDPTFLARGAVESFINKLDTNSRAGVLIFDHSVTQAVPLTAIDADGKAALIKSLENINYRGQLIDSPAAVERAIYELKTNKRDGGDQFIIFMTDGIVDTGNPADVEKTKWLREDLAVDAADNGIKVFAIAFTEYADFFLIQSLAKKTHGEYFRALSPADLAGVFDTVHAKLSEPSASPPEPVAPPPVKAPEATVITPLPDDTVTSQPLPAPQDPAELLASLSANERKALEEISEQTGIPIEQLALELVGPDTGGTAEQPESGGAIITYPEEEITEAEQRMGYAILAASAAFLLLLVGFIVWFIMRQRKSSRASVATATAAPVPADTPAIPEAFINDVHGYTDEPVIRLSEDEEDLGVEINLDVVGDGMPEDYDEDGEDLGIEINLATVGEAGQDEDFDAEALAFFEDITVGPMPDDDMFDIAGGADTNDDSALDAKLDQASAILDSTATTGGALREPDDPNDLTMEQFIETDSFDAPATIPPVDPRAVAEEEELDDITLDAFMSTSLFAAKVEVTNEDMTVLPEQVPDNPNNEDDMFSSDTVVLPGSPAKDKKKIRRRWRIGRSNCCEVENGSKRSKR